MTKNAPAMTQPLSAPGSPWLDDSKSKGSTPEAEEPELEPEEDEPTTKIKKAPAKKAPAGLLLR